MIKAFIKQKIPILLTCLISFTIGFNLVCHPAIALLREHHQSPGVLRYHAQHSIKDKQKRAWQIILFPEDKESTTTKYYLRLVGFPDLVEFVHPQPLEILTSQGNVLIAPDVFADSTPAPNVGQYDVTDLMSQLTSEGSVKLIFSLLQSDRKVRDVTLKINPSTIAEWQLLKRSPITSTR